jgi:transcriptional regulator with XRE-family HTH domain
MVLDVGPRIHQLRSSQGLTLQVLARGSGVSRAMLSDVERGHRSPTVKILSQIAVGLGCPVSQLLEEDAPNKIRVERTAQHPTVIDELTGVERRSLASPDLPAGLELVWYVLPPGSAMCRGPDEVRYIGADAQESGSFPPNPHGSGEHVTVVAGRVSLSDSDSSRVLRVGDSASYQLTRPVVFTNPGRSPSRLLLLLNTRRIRRF